MKHHSDDPSRSEEELCRSLVDAVLSGGNFAEIQERCLALTTHPSRAVRGLVATCFGHLARVHGRLDLDRVQAALEALATDKDLAGPVEDAWDDIRSFLPKESLDQS